MHRPFDGSFESRFFVSEVESMYVDTGQSNLHRNVFDIPLTHQL